MRRPTMEDPTNWRPPKRSAETAGLPSYTVGNRPGVVERASLKRLTGPKTALSAEAPESEDGPQEQSETLEMAYQRGLTDGQAMKPPAVPTDQLLALGTLLNQISQTGSAVILDLSMSVARRILRKAIKVDPQWILSNARTCLERQPPNGPLKLHLCPLEHKQLLALKPPPPWLQGRGAVSLVLDPSLQPGDCIVESERGRIDARVESQLENLREVLQDAIASVLFEENDG